MSADILLIIMGVKINKRKIATKLGFEPILIFQTENC